MKIEERCEGLLSVCACAWVYTCVRHRWWALTVNAEVVAFRILVLNSSEDLGEVLEKGLEPGPGYDT